MARAESSSRSSSADASARIGTRRSRSSSSSGSPANATRICGPCVSVTLSTAPSGGNSTPWLARAS